jgi:predicted secreted protein
MLHALRLADGAVMNTWDMATAYTAPEIERALASIDDLLYVHKRPDDPRRILQAVADELRDARRWRADNMATADAAADAYRADLARTAEAAGAVDTVRACLGAFGDHWRRALPATAWHARRFVHLDILAAAGDREHMAAALERHYGPERSL